MSKPHVALINISFLVHPVSPSGEISGATVDRQALLEHGLKSKLIRVKGNTLDECLENLRNKLDGIN